MVYSCLDSQICVPCSSVLLIKELLQVATLEESVVYIYSALKICTSPTFSVRQQVTVWMGSSAKCE